MNAAPWPVDAGPLVHMIAPRQTSLVLRASAHVPIGSTAILSACGRYRYELTRPIIEGAPRSLVFLMLNPSTADAMENDNTIRRCIGYAAREGVGALVVVNLYAFRSKNPGELFDVADPVGPLCDRVLRLALRRAGRDGSTVCAAWGASRHPGGEERIEAVLALAERAGVRSFVCLGETSSGEPRHPLRLRADQPLVPWWESIG